MPIFYLSEKISFPPPRLAQSNGLLAVGGDLSVKRLLLAYRLGIFPWFSHDEPILWWSPDPRLVLYPNEFRISKSLKKIIRKKVFKITLDTAFPQVITECAYSRRRREEGTWITEEMIDAYCEVHEQGYAHSAEAWCDGELVGGLYGISLGRCFFGESMFTQVSNASKVAFTALTLFLKKRAFEIIDCQVTTDHLMRFGAREIERKKFLAQLKNALDAPTLKGKWTNLVRRQRG
ncbi:leucyl/phenylalanyl-tRNA--protein transferase [Desulfococcaceae bacterium HSG9]|nr:leucyl/phenylalanyl-tRNA--protein transferase [Desulfococcaceae bacterium HSG9]